MIELPHKGESEMEEEETVFLLVEKALKKAEEDHKTRSMALTITKLQEAKMWYSEHLKELRAAANKVGFSTPQS